MPLALRWGAGIPGGRKIDDFTCHTDFAPTFLEAAGVEIPEEMTGRSLLPILTSDAEGVVDASRDRVFTATERHTWCRPGGATYPVRAMRTRDYLYMRNFEPDRWPTGGPVFVSSNKTFHGDVDACPTKSFMVDDANLKKYPEHYRLCFGKRPAEELYKISDDPGQIHNLADDPRYREIVEKCAAELMAHLVKSGDPRMVDRDPWREYVYHQVDGFGMSYNRTLPADIIQRAKLRPGN
jgi:uncharacterized sulfatase